MTEPVLDATVRKFKIGDLVKKIRGSDWRGHVCGFYSATYTLVGYAVESHYEAGNVQVYPEAALEPWDGKPPEIKAADIGVLLSRMRLNVPYTTRVLWYECRGRLDHSRFYELLHKAISEGFIRVDGSQEHGTFYYKIKLRPDDGSD